MRRRLLLGLVLLVIVPSLLSVPSFAQDPGEHRVDLDPQGKPPVLASRALAYWIWRDSDGYHLRTTAESGRHIFSGWVEVDRDFVLQTHFKQEGNDYVRKVGRRVEFRFATAGNPDGFDFTASWPHAATFYVEIDGRSGPDILNRVFIGGQSVHPKTNPFSLVPAALRGLNPAGRPTGYRSGEPRAYWIWQDREGFHLRATTDRQRHVFSGWVEADGSIDVRSASGLERTDFVLRQGKRVYFHLVVVGAEDGFDFSVSGASPVTFFLMIDGEFEEAVNRVYVGRDGVHPKDNPFTVRQ